PVEEISDRGNEDGVGGDQAEVDGLRQAGGGEGREKEQCEENSKGAAGDTRSLSRFCLIARVASRKSHRVQCKYADLRQPARAPGLCRQRGSIRPGKWGCVIPERWPCRSRRLSCPLSNCDGSKSPDLRQAFSHVASSLDTHTKATRQQ